MFGRRLKTGEIDGPELRNRGKSSNFAAQITYRTTIVDKFGCLQPLKKMLKLRLNFPPAKHEFTANLAFFHFTKNKVER